MSRHPYTYAADFVRVLAGSNEHGSKLSRSDASKIRSGIAAALGMDDEELAYKLSDYYRNQNGSAAVAVVKDLSSTPKMKFGDVPLGTAVAMVEPMNDEVRCTYYERIEGTATFSPHYTPAVRLRTVQGSSNGEIRYERDSYRIDTEMPKAQPVVLASETPNWFKKNDSE